MEELQAMLELARGGIAELLVKQREVLGLPA
jgi:ribonuclease PH